MQLQFCKGFRFEFFCTKVEGLSEVVQKAWDKPVQSQDAIKPFAYQANKNSQGAKEMGQKKNPRN
jgi:hypothetical protein